VARTGDRDAAVVCNHVLCQTGDERRHPGSQRNAAVSAQASSLRAVREGVKLVAGHTRCYPVGRAREADPAPLSLPRFKA